MTVTRNSVVNPLYTNFVFFFFAMERFDVHQISQTNQLIMHHNLSKRFQFKFIATNYSDINFSEEKQSQDLWEKIAIYFLFIAHLYFKPLHFHKLNNELKPVCKITQLDS